MAFLTVSDLSPFTSLPLDQLAIIIADLEAVAVQAAGCLADPDVLSVAQRAAVVAVLRSAALRWSERASGQDRSLAAGPFTYGQAPGMQSSETRRPLLWPSEISSLQGVCAAGGRPRAVMRWAV